MQRHKRHGFRNLPTTALILAATWLALGWPRADAAPFTDHFDPLIADLESRAATLSNSTVKAQQQQFKTIQTVLKGFLGKNSTSLATDIRNLGSAAKTLAKSFPGDFGTPGGPFGTDLETALQGLAGDVQTTLDTTQTTLDGLGATPCATKAQTTLNTASNQVAAASAAANFATASKLLGSGLTSALKAGAAAAKCTSSSGGGGGGGGGSKGDSMKATISGDITLNFSASVVTVTTNANTMTVIGGASALGGIAIGFTAGNVTAPGTYDITPNGSVTRLNPGMLYSFGSGSVTFTTVDIANQKVAGTFSFTANQTVPAGSGVVTVSNGSFSATKIGHQ